MVSQGFVVAASAHSAARACDAHLTGAVADLLRDSPHLLAAPWLPAGLADVPPAMLCKAYALGTQVGGRAGVGSRVVSEAAWSCVRLLLACHRFGQPAMPHAPSRSPTARLPALYAPLSTPRIHCRCCWASA